MAFVVTLREGLEAALIVGIILAYLKRIGARQGARYVWWGVGLALALTAVTGGVVAALALRLSGAALEIFEGSAMFLAAAVLTWMIFGMKRQATAFRLHLQAQVDRALAAGGGLALGLLAFTAVAREGLETVLFLTGGASMAASPAAYWLGAGLGLLGAAALGYLAYAGTGRLPLHAFFSVSGLLLIAFAGGMVINGIKEFQEVGLIPPLVKPVWDTYALVPDTSVLGRFLSSLFSYDPTPSLVQVLAHWAYLVTVTALFLRPPSRGGVSSPAA